jgi:hypothetical protein
MNIIFKVLIIKCILLCNNALFAQSDLVKENKFAADYANVILQISKEIDSELPAKKLKEIDRQLFEKIFTEKIGRFAELYDEALDIPSAQKQVFKNLLKYMNIETLYNIFTNTIKSTRVFFRKKSFGIGIAVFMGVASEYLFPFISIQSGLGIIAPLSPFVPWSITYMKVPNMIQKLKMKRKLTFALGGKSGYLNYMDHIDKMKAALKLESPEHFLFPIELTDEGTEVVVGSRTSLFRNLLGKLGFFQDSISFESLMRFSVLHNSLDPYIRYVSLMDAPRDTKTLLIAQHIIKNGDDNLKLAFRKKFSPHIFTLKNVETWSGMYDWTKRALQVVDLNDFLQLIQEMPAEIDVREFFGIYENILLPKYSENFDIGYTEYRKLLQNFQVIKASVLESGDLNFHVENRAEFIKYLNLSLEKGRLSPCKNNHNQVLNLLMRSI